MIVVIYGTRPEAIKLAPVVDELRRRDVPTLVVCTEQHQELLGAHSIDTHYRLFTHAEVHRTPDIFVPQSVYLLNRFMDDKEVSFVLVQGDTASAFAGALAAFHQQAPIGHVEAGLRTYHLDAPFPEEGYRQMIDRIATRRYAPTEDARWNLNSEGIDQGVLVTGNTGIDAALAVVRTGSGTSRARPGVRYVLVTLHRRESFGEPLEAICRGLLEIADRGIHIVFPVHLNPEVQKATSKLVHPLIDLVAPLSYPDLIQTMLGAFCVLTDSGGIQEEAPTLGIPVLVAREVTERPEAVRCGNAKLVGYNEDRILGAVLRLHDDEDHRQTMTKKRNMFGDGNASVRIVDDVVQWLEQHKKG